MVDLTMFIAPAVAAIIAVIGWYRTNRRKREKEMAEKENQSIGVNVSGWG